VRRVAAFFDLHGNVEARDGARAQIAVPVQIARWQGGHFPYYELCLRSKSLNPETLYAVLSFAMSANVEAREMDGVEDAVLWLRDRVPGSWKVERRPVDSGTRGAGTDASIEIQAGGVFSTVIVEARPRLAPRDVERLFGSLGRKLRASSPHTKLLVVAPWLSARTRALLDAEDVNYIDATGNALVRLDNPALFVRMQGASREPSPAARAPARVRRTASRTADPHARRRRPALQGQRARRGDAAHRGLRLAPARRP
jgi:hypothetical protein